MNYQSCRLSNLEAFLEASAPGRLTRCRELWSKLSAELRPFVDLPEGELLLINDYD